MPNTEETTPAETPIDDIDILTDSTYNFVHIDSEQMEVFNRISDSTDLLLNRFEFLLLINIVLLMFVIYQMFRSKIQ